MFKSRNHSRTQSRKKVLSDLEKKSGYFTAGLTNYHHTTLDWSIKKIQQLQTVTTACISKPPKTK